MGRLAGRVARAEHSSRVGQDWDTGIEQVYSYKQGFQSAKEHYVRFGSGSKLNQPVGMRFFKRTHCGEPIKIDESGYAHCQVCNLTFNTGTGDGEKAKRVIKAVGYDPAPENAPPPIRHRKPKELVKACKRAARTG
jgi:hypothetical protein